MNYLKITTISLYNLRRVGDVIHGIFVLDPPTSRKFKSAGKSTLPAVFARWS